ncbi:MAG: TonB-dependent receptor [Gloeobacteraceae cyanobacterium ES-bin-316]|nr:TonB-dependent receptor [Ferruginibacter sp.]
MKLLQLRVPLILCFLLFFSVRVFAQTTINGTVTSDDGIPLSGVTVTEKGTKNVVVSTATGLFSIEVASDKSILIFSFSSYLPKEVMVGNTTNFSIELSIDQQQLEDVVVVGYGKQKKVTSVGAQSAISTKELVQSPVANISNSLVGRMAGLFATQGSGEPGNDQSRILIRGIGTFSGNQGPLILVDGIQVDNYNNIDPNEIEAVTILKDASSTAVYGIRGANGVLIITTKRGKTGAPVVSYSFNNAFNSFTGIREQMNSFDFASSFNQALKNDTYLTGGAYTPKYSAADLIKYQTGEDPIFFPNINWYDVMLKKTSLQQQHNLNIRGGTDKVKYFISAGMFNQEGLFNDNLIKADFDPQIKYKRYNFRSNFNFDVSRRFKVALDLSSQIENRNGNNASTTSIVNYIAGIAPLASPGVLDGRIVTLTPSIGNGGNLSNPVSILYASGYKTDYRNLLNGSLRLDHELDFITKGLSMHGIVAYQNFSRQISTYTKPIITYQARRLVDNSILYIKQADESPFAFAQTNPDRTRRTTMEFAFDYKRSFGGHNVTGLLLYNQIKTFDPSFAFGVPNGYQSYVGRAVYDYNGRYLAEFSAAYNGTENFAPGERFGFFPSYSLGWVPTAEKFFPKNDLLTFLKIRGSYGEVGNDQLSGDFLSNANSRFLYRPTAFSATGSYFFGTVGANYVAYNAVREGRANNPFLTWERALKSNLGIEANLLKNKINLVVDLFKEDRDNILAVPQTVSAIVGTPLAAQNLGKMSNKGYEIDLTYRDNLHNFNYWVKANYSFAKNKVLFQDEVTRLFPYQQRTGQQFGQIFGLISEGLYNSWEEVNDHNRPISTFAGSNRIQPGDIKYRDVNGDGFINFQDEVPIGFSTTPQKIFGISFGGSWKGIDFSALFQGADNVSISYSRRANQAFFDVDPAAAAQYLLESWSQERYDNGLPIKFPRLSVGNGANGFTHNTVNSTYWTNDASYIRLKNVELGYTFKASLLQKLRIKSTRIYANANNLFTWSNVLPGIDPETPTLPANNEPYPLVRTVNVGININF